MDASSGGSVAVIECDGYDVLVGVGALQLLASKTIKTMKASRFVVITDTTVKGLFGEHLEAALQEVCRSPCLLLLTPTGTE